jgi:putative addiction module CopG family antidote
MKISLSPEIERLIADRVSSGRYQSADEVVREGLELLEEREKHARHAGSDGARSLGESFESIAREAPEAEWEKVPSDLSKSFNHYLI